MVTISKLHARTILDSRGFPTIETVLTLSDGAAQIASVPSGASVGTYEAFELRDGDTKNYAGKGVAKAVENVNSLIAKSIVGKSPLEQKQIDELMLELDGTENKASLGANAILSVSIATAKAGAYLTKVPMFKYIANLSGTTTLAMPKLLCNLINGGMHANWNLDIQEFIIIPVRALSVKEALAQTFNISINLKKVLGDMGIPPLVGDEGGFAPKLATNEEALSLLEQVISQTGLVLGNDISLGIDAAASCFYKDGKYHLKDLGQGVSGVELSAYYKKLAARYQLLYLEDLFAEEDFSLWEEFVKTTDTKLLITGDDLTVTNPQKLKFALDKNLIRAVVVKPNQIGTLTEALTVCSLAKEAGITSIVSHRSGETNDDFIADFAVGVGARFVKFGAPVRGERVAKYNRLLKIEEELS